VVGQTVSRRAWARWSALCVLAGTAALAVAVIGSQGGVYGGYVSEAGVAGQPYWIAYRIGIFGLAAGFVLLAGAVRPVHRLAALILLGSGLLAGTSGTVSCTDGCPLPPFETPTARDLVHGGTSIAGVALCALAVLVLAVFAPAGDLRHVSRVAIAPIVAAGLVNAYALVFLGRGYTTGAAERLLLVLLVAWCLAAAFTLGFRRTGTPPPGSA
jgi:hypothetical protein